MGQGLRLFSTWHVPAMHKRRPLWTREHAIIKMRNSTKQKARESAADGKQMRRKRCLPEQRPGIAFLDHHFSAKRMTRPAAAVHFPNIMQATLFAKRLPVDLAIPHSAWLRSQHTLTASAGKVQMLVNQPCHLGHVDACQSLQNLQDLREVLQWVGR